MKSNEKKSTDEPDGAEEETLLGKKVESAGEQEKRREDSVINTHDPDQVRFYDMILHLRLNQYNVIGEQDVGNAGLCEASLSCPWTDGGQAV